MNETGKCSREGIFTAIAAPDPPAKAWAGGVANDVLSFPGNLSLIGTAEAAGTGASVQPQVIPNANQYIAQFFYSPLDGQPWCVAFIQAVDPSIGRTAGWVEGSAVTPDTPLGTVVATFGASGTYLNSTVTSHVGIFEGFDSAGNMTLIDQYPGSNGVNTHFYKSSATTIIGNPANYHVVLVH